ncbi:MAG: acetyl ornithine aminotransferase family protein [Polyangiaceae bacterium]|nr:acetyl ornithine aminotransferase family protein [Polyangiaceae bacterium]
MRRPLLKTSLPGPKARAIIDESDAFISTSYTRDFPLVADHAEGAWITDPDGNEFLDVTAGIAVCATGHCHPRVVAAICEQAKKLVHMSGTDFHYGVQGDLAMRLARLGAVRGEGHRVYFGNSGAEAIEAAIKLCRYKTRRPGVLAFLGAFHGRTLGAVSATASKVVQRGHFGPLLPGFYHAIYPDPVRHGRDATRRAMEHIDVLLHRLVGPDELAAILVEPIQGEGGYVVPPDDFLGELRQLCDAHGILLVFDEVQSGMGRTGKMFAWQHVGVAPDVICLAKGIASGMPLSATIARSEVMDWPPGTHASTFGGNPVSCAAAMATLDLLEGELCANAAAVGAAARALLEQKVGTHPRVGAIRGRGLMLAVDLVRDRQTLEPDPALRHAVVERCFYSGLLVLGCGPSAIRLCPALSLGADDAATAVDILVEALAACAP